jgi:hypothetical protein
LFLEGEAASSCGPPTKNFEKILKIEFGILFPVQEKRKKTGPLQEPLSVVKP